MIMQVAVQSVNARRSTAADLQDRAAEGDVEEGLHGGP